MKNFTKSIFVFLILILLFTISANIKASGISVSPSKLEINKLDSQKIIIVANPSADVMLFEVSSDDFSEDINIMPQSFTLESGSRKEVVLKLKTEKFNNQNIILATNISVLAKPLAESKFSVATGVKIPLTIVLENLPKKSGISFNFKAIFVLGFVVIFSILIILLKKFKKFSNLK